MVREEVFHKGERGRPLVVFIHGMGMSMKMWSNPDEARILGGKYPLSTILGERQLSTSFNDVREIGFPVLTWSQSRPSGPIQAAVNELRELLREYRKYADAGVIMIGHSRGGLVARKYLEKPDCTIRGLITVGSPHHGASMAKWAVYLSPLTASLNLVLGGFRRREVETALRKVLGFFSSSGLKELLPGSDFFAHLRDERREGAYYISAGGTKPDLIKVGGVSVADLLARALPDGLVPEEMRDGYGDGLVSAASSVLPHADDHRNFSVNHLSVLFDREVRDFIARAAEKC